MPQKNRHLWIVFVVVFFQSCTCEDIITQNQSFKDGDLLVSSGNNFAFGFFSPGNSLNRYVGIWYNKVSEITVVWVANRDNPITNGSSHGVLSIENSGNLVLRDQTSNMSIWSTKVPGTTTANSYFVRLLDTGNLALFQSHPNSDIILWESFHYPTNTLLPEMKLGVNRTSGAEWSLTSWKSLDDPGTGDFLLKMDLNGLPQIYLYKNSVRFWRSGPWNGITMGGAPDMNRAFTFLAVYYIENDEEISYSYFLTDPAVISRVAINESGLKERQTWQEDQHKWTRYLAVPKDECDYYGHCGPFSNCDPFKPGEFECLCLPGFEPKFKSEWDLRDGHNGCKRKAGEPTCGNSSSDAEFIKLAFVKVPDTANAVVNRILGLEECGNLCLKNCSCTAYASYNVSKGGSGCITWYGDLTDIRQYSSNGGQDIYIKVSQSERDQYLKHINRSKSKKFIIPLVVVPSIAGVLLMVFATWLVLWRRKDETEFFEDHLLSYLHVWFPFSLCSLMSSWASIYTSADKTHNLTSLLSLNLDPGSSHGGTTKTEEIDKNGDFSLFHLKTISSATNCFAAANKLGEGGFGSVYKGELQNGKEIAIKRLSKSSGQGIEEFKNEVTLIARLQHRNLVKLLGCCIQQEEKMLVYEYLPNKGLDNFIFDKEKGALLDWRKRFNIILGIARGIVYLHRDSRLRIIHRDLKASNVLLDANMEPKISDFGMAKAFNADQVEEKTRRVVGTYGYMPPEYVMRGLFSEKSDVFSYGVLLLEIICGKRNNSFFSDNIVNLTGYIWELWKEGNALDIVDPTMGESCNLDEVVRCIHIGLLCVQEHTNDRPTMSKVLSMLGNETLIPATAPKQPAFVIKNIKCDNSTPPCSSLTALRPCVDVMTITILEPR